MRVRSLAGMVVVAVIAAGCGSSASKATPPAAGIGAVSFGGLGSSGPIGVVAVGSATQEVAADLAFVVVSTGSGFGGVSSSTGPVTFGPNGQPIFPTPTTAVAANDHGAVRNALRTLGIASDAIEFSVADPSGVLPNSGNGTVQVEVPVGKLPAIATSVVTALTQVGVSGSTGLRFGVLDCTAALSTARSKALADARTRAQGLATAAGVTLGALTAVSESSAQSSSLAYLSNGGQSQCGRSAFQNISGLSDSFQTPLAALTAKPQVELSESISVAYALATAPRTMAAVGEGEATGPADAGDIFVVPQEGPSIDPTTPTSVIDEARVVGALAPLGITNQQVEVENPASVSQIVNPGSAYVRVHVTVAQLKSIGSKIVASVESVIGTSAASGVLFSASNCTALATRARVAAARDAGLRLDKLAATAKVHLGAIVGVSDAELSVYLPAIDPCKPDLSSSNFSVVSQLLSGGGSTSPSLSPIDATPSVTEHVSLSISRAMTS